MDTKSLISLWNHTQQHKGTSGARVCAQVLLGLYNGTRFPMDITELRVLDTRLRTAALQVIAADSTFCRHEVHTWLNLLSDTRDFGQRFEELAWEYLCFKRGRTKLSELPAARMPAFVIVQPNEMPALRGDTYECSPAVRGMTMRDGALKSTVIVDELFDEEVKRATPMMTGPVALNATQAAAVATMVDNFDMDAHHRAMTTPFFNDLAG